MFQRLRRAWAARPGTFIFLLLSLLAVVSGLLWASFASTWTLAGLVLAGLGGLLLLVGCLIVFPPLFAGPTRVRTHQRLLLENEIRTTLLQALLGMVVLLGAVSGWQQFMGTSQELKISRNTQITEQLSAATDQLGADEVEVRLGAIYTLERLLRTAEGPEGEEDSLTVYKLLAGYIKARSPWPARPLDEDEQRRRVDRYMPLEIESLRKRLLMSSSPLKSLAGATSNSLPAWNSRRSSATPTSVGRRSRVCGSRKPT
jgi:DNA-binding transcriptional regulator YiaG